MLLNKLHNEDCLLTMKNMETNSIDCIVTDPPYGYSFMGKDWDKVVPSVEIWSECLRVMKPGAFAFIMSAPRQDVLSHMIINLDKAGFDTSFTSIYWTYASGFPKAMNISKAVDKKLGVEREVIGEKIRGDVQVAKEKGVGFLADPANKNNVKQFGYGIEQITEATSEEAKKLDGSYGGFQPKPAVEIIIVVMKPITEKSLTEQALNNGKGITWLDDCRIPFEINDTPKGGFGKMDIGIGKPTEHQTYRKTERKPRTVDNVFKQSGFNSESNYTVDADPAGRFPANLLVSDDVLNDGKLYAGQQGEVTGDEKSKFERGNTHGDYSGVGNPMKPRNDAGSFSRYYDLDKWWEERINTLPPNVKEIFPFLITPKAAKSEKNFGVNGDGKFMDESREVGSSGGTNPRNRGAETKRKNYHPTVKPIKLMSYLVTLGSREHDTIYDPFSGSGTTLIAARMIARNFIGSEIEKEYFDIAEQRLLPFTSQASLF